LQSSSNIGVKPAKKPRKEENSKKLGTKSSSLKPNLTPKLGMKKEKIVNKDETGDYKDFQIEKTSDGGGICLKCIPPKHFSQFSSCNRHYISVHSEDGEKKHECLVCSEMFALKTNLNTHLKGKHGLKGKIKIFNENGALAKTDAGEGVCLLCKKTFSRFDSCNRHYQATHQSKGINGTQNIAYSS
jgi:hypothetical protein